MLKVKKVHFLQSSQEIGQNGDNDTLPYDTDSVFLKEKSDEIANICINLFDSIESGRLGKPLDFMNSINIHSEKLLTPSGSHGFRITSKIHPFWNTYFNGLGLAIAEANERNRSARAHSYRLGRAAPDFFDRTKSWRSYKEATLQEIALENEHTVVVQTDIGSFYEHIYHHRLENIIRDLASPGSTIAMQVDRILNKFAAGRSFGLPVGGQCARVLAEVMMTPIDQSLSDAGIIWHRYVDDFTLICRSQQDAYKALSVLSHSLADYGLSLNRSKTTFLSAKHYKDFVSAQLGRGDDASTALRDLDLHFDPYSDQAHSDYQQLKASFDHIDIALLLNIETSKSLPDTFVVTQISRALKFQDAKVAAQLCATLLEPNNLDGFRASWSKIMRGIYSVRANEHFVDIFSGIDEGLDNLSLSAGHLLVPEANLLHYLRALRFVRTDARGAFVRKTFDSASSAAVRRACIDCWRHWADRMSFTRLRGLWSSLGSEEQRMIWLASSRFGDEGKKMRDQLRGSIAQTWRLGFEIEGSLTFATCYVDWAKNAA